ncbi:acyl-CoA dehydrogenase family protein [Rhizobacter sp. SG703]|uniref:acyl-CoA dehydrogenase family protein n=1 Tax=Rhizobacter sp. SG703 TaxID=2587140 RepID=UPI0014467CB8|nr:acyl-CoA dehydrogenase family protein [Rhizobacter sp. SG703]NKI95354.1 acyl-CoA dehydrogenase [Rhizobacter sp. SG703]
MQPTRLSPQLPALLEGLHGIGRDIIAPHAAEVDRDARFPHEAYAALRQQKLLSCYVPVEYGGMGLNISDLSQICEVLGQYCGSTAMIFAMHQIQVGCIVHHALESEFFQAYAREMVEKQTLIASATTELGIGGDVRSSLCAVQVNGDRFTLEKQTPVISYGATADAILVTCRKSEDAARNDQVQVLVRRGDYELTKLSGWDTLGFRGTCSEGFVLKSQGRVEQILPQPYADIHRRTMHPFSHVVWASLWLGLSIDAVSRARSAVRAEARKNPSVTPISATRLAELDTVLFSMRGGVYQTLREYHDVLIANDPEAYSGFSFAININNLKLTASQFVVEVVGKAMLICGIQGYRNDSKLTLGRHLRDAYGAALMVNNDRILGQSATMQIVQR